jgi:hypothetical protein
MPTNSERGAAGELKPVCFMVMPFGRRKVEGQVVPPGAPGEIDCDALWDRVLRPVIEELGYLPLRADADTGSVIVKDMLERLAYAHLVLADVTLRNGNVYYEIGLRHVARETGCVLLAANWSRQLFDIEQFRSIRYPLADGRVPAREARRIRALLLEAIPHVRDARTPWHELIATRARRTGERAFSEQSEAASRLQARMRTARLSPPAQRSNLVNSILADMDPATLTIPEVACELMSLVRDAVGWQAVLDFAGTLPESTRKLAFVQEQELLALAETGQPLEAIGRLEALVAEHGDSAERQGLIGGRYKRLWKAAQEVRQARGAAEPSQDERRYLDKAIEHYTRGMEIDYNLYYCSGNLPSLLHARGETGDAKRAVVVDYFVLAACERALARGEHDDWLRPTLLGAAFRAADVRKALDLARQVEREGAAAWKLGSTLLSLDLAVQQTADDEAREGLRAIYERLTRVLHGS